jgi:thiopurine S-methyltransferase
MRKAYMEKLLRGLPHSTKWLLVTFEYDEARMQGPPFSVCQNEVGEYFKKYNVCLVNKEEMIGSMPKAQSLGLSSIHQCVYVIAP